jgi:hypothetical protein
MKGSEKADLLLEVALLDIVVDSNLSDSEGSGDQSVRHADFRPGVRLSRVAPRAVVERPRAKVRVVKWILMK